MSTSLLLDTSTWDLVLDASGNIATCTAPYQLAQDVACMVRTFLGECYYNNSIGVPYLQQILGQFSPLNLIKTLILQQAVLVPGCVNPTMYITSFNNRVLVGQIQFTVGSVVQTVPVIFDFSGTN